MPARARRVAAEWFEGTPGRMRVLLLIALVLSILFGGAVAQTLRDADGSLGRAQDNTAQLVRVQTIHTSLVSANADATKAFLRGGLEPPAQRQQFVRSLDTAARLITEASKAQPADADALGALNTTLVSYRGLIEQARSNNRQGLPVGAQYLKDANTLIKTDALPVLNALVTANERRLDEEFSHTGTGRVWVLVAGVVALLALIGVMVWLARHSHRYLNVPLLSAALLVLVTTAVGAGLLTVAKSRADEVRDSSYAATVALAGARINGYDAQSNENLTLIARGSGAEFDRAWTTSARTTRERLATSTQHGVTKDGGPNQWGTYETAHQRIRELDTGGRWEEAVGQALGPAATSFDAFDQTSQRSLDRTSAAAQSGLGNAGSGLSLLGWLGLPIGLLVALLAWWGLSQRLEEYR
ncbi:hypothetical protein PZ938_06195 [Luteipulveratus sp. YIM 133132]|uniref:hypothetical protein n=1 Tax=Luteipulveratus flavus TaxID=3031728 RepID=UPI0023B12AC8|nr:hypothetical protein [Luteipulveratus sp. YIM 133132]MDE9365191.1 hypothetical protein [Luteipulveratus sp. YIM 133132]